LSACRVIVALSVVALWACSRYPPHPRRDGPPREGSPAQDVVTSNCTPSGRPAWCNPLQNTGCVAGHCYVLKDVGTACVCPEGSREQGEACNTTTDCAAGLVCAGTQPPGVCRELCDPRLPGCASGLMCTAIKDFWDFGFCEPEQG